MSFDYKVKPYNVKLEFKEDMIELDLDKYLPSLPLLIWFKLTKPEGYIERRAFLLAKKANRRTMNKIITSFKNNLSSIEKSYWS